MAIDKPHRCQDQLRQEGGPRRGGHACRGAQPGLSLQARAGAAQVAATGDPGELRAGGGELS